MANVPDLEKRNQTADSYFGPIIISVIEDMLNDLDRTGLTRDEVYWFGIGCVRGMSMDGTFNDLAAERTKAAVIRTVYGNAGMAQRTDRKQAAQQTGDAEAVTEQSHHSKQRVVAYDPKQHKPLYKWRKGKPSKPGSYTVIYKRMDRMFVTQGRWDGERWHTSRGGNDFKSCTHYLPETYAPCRFYGKRGTKWGKK